MTKHLNKQKKTDVGQTFVLAVAMLLVLSFIVFTTIGIGWKTKERIRLQNTSDISAYSQATKTARAFNYFAYTNRSIASHLVSMMVAHSYESEITAVVGLYWNLAATWALEFLIQEAAVGGCHYKARILFKTRCIHSIGWPIFLAHEAEDIFTIIRLAGKEWGLSQSLKRIDAQFDNTIKGLYDSIDEIRKSQSSVGAELVGNIPGVSFPGVSYGLENLDIGTVATPGLLKGNSPAAKLNGVADDYTARSLNDAINITTGSGKNASSDNNSSKGAKIDITDVANSARPLWVRNRWAGFSLDNLQLPVLTPLINKVKSVVKHNGYCTFAQIPFLQGQTGLYSYDKSLLSGLFPQWIKGMVGYPLQAPAAGVQGRQIFAMDYWTIPYCTCGHKTSGRNKRLCTGGAPFGLQPFPVAGTSGLPQQPARMATGKNSFYTLHAPGAISPSNLGGSYVTDIIMTLTGLGAHHMSVKHPITAWDRLLSFQRFLIIPNGSYNQPIVYKSMTQNLAVNERGGRQPWDIYESGKFKGNIFGTTSRISFFRRLITSVHLSGADEATVFSKAMVYYHRPGHWKEPPNFWNPHWRAKLHPWSTAEFKKLAKKIITSETYRNSYNIYDLMNGRGAFSESSDLVMDGLN